MSLKDTNVASATTYNFTIILVAALGSLFAGYSLAVIISTVGQPTWYKSLNLVEDPEDPRYGHTTTIIGATNGAFFAAGFFGTFLSAWLDDHAGRVWSIRVAAIIGIIGASIQTGATNQAMYIVARFITGFAAGQLIATMPTYYAEVAPPRSRGLMAGAHGTFINMGYALSNWIGYACFNAGETSFAWRFPNAVLVILGLLVLSGSFFVPESPRWLVSKNRSKEALVILQRLHDNEKHVTAQHELRLIEERLEKDREAIKTDGRWQIFTKRTYRRRLILAIMVIVGGQNVGVLVINNYNTLLYSSLGLTAAQSLIVSAAYNTWSMTSNFLGALVSDRFGRRTIMLFGYTGAICMFAVATGLIAKFSETESSTLAGVAVAFLFLYVTFYGGCIDVNQFTIAAEIFPSHLRSQGNSLAIACLFATDALWVDLASTARATIGWKYYLVFLCLGLVHLVYFIFRLPETARIPLEELDLLF